MCVVLTTKRWFAHDCPVEQACETWNAVLLSPDLPVNQRAKLLIQIAEAMDTESAWLVALSFCSTHDVADVVRASWFDVK